MFILHFKEKSYVKIGILVVFCSHINYTWSIYANCKYIYVQYLYVLNKLKKIILKCYFIPSTSLC